MAWAIKREENKYRIYSTIIDDYITGLLTRKQTIEFIRRAWKEDLEARVEELRATFPNGWTDSEDWKQIEDGKYLSQSEYARKKLSKLDK